MNSLLTFGLVVLSALALAEARHHAHHSQQKRHLDQPVVIPVDQVGHAHGHKHLPFLTVDDQREYISYDEEQKPYVRCASNTDPKVPTKKCYLPDGPTYDMGLACYTLWQGDTVVKDCWVNQMISLSQCQKRRCSAPDSPLGIQFCCCFGHECNENFEVEA